jgi:hypothetical protein
MDKPPKDTFWLDYWVKHRERALDAKWYAIQRVDLLIISISSGGIYIIFETIKFILEKQRSIDFMMLKLSGLFFALAIVFNLTSQFYGWNANKHESIYAGFKVRQERGGEVGEDKIDNTDRLVKISNRRLNIMNLISVAAMSLGLVLLLLFALLVF